jgi:serine/threonine protein kinase
MESLLNPNKAPRYGALKRVRPSSRLSRGAKLEAVNIELRSLLLPRLRSHDNIVTILGIGWEDDINSPDISWPVILLEYADLGNLASYQERRLTLRYQTKKSLCLDIALGLLALHDFGICHGDIKSENILLFSHPKRGIIGKLGDFGFSVSTFTYPDTDDPGDQKLPGGTPPWNAPEYGKKIPADMLKFTDIYSYGLLVWRTMIDGESPFDDVIDFVFPERGPLDFLYGPDYAPPPRPSKDKMIEALKSEDHELWKCAQNALFRRKAIHGESDIYLFIHEIMGVLGATLSPHPEKRTLEAAILSLKVTPEEWEEQGR